MPCSALTYLFNPSVYAEQHVQEQIKTKIESFNDDAQQLYHRAINMMKASSYWCRISIIVAIATIIFCSLLIAAIVTLPAISITLGSLTVLSGVIALYGKKLAQQKIYELVTENAQQIASPHSKPEFRMHRAVLFGQAIGDQIGLFTEFTTKECALHVLNGKPIKLSERDNYISRHVEKPGGHPGHIQKFPKGGWTDDTDQAVCLRRAYYRFLKHDQDQAEKIFPQLVAEEIWRWRYQGGLAAVPAEGFKGRKDAVCAGLGSLVGEVVEQPNFRQEPIQTARHVWAQKTGSYDTRPAANGAIMRTAVLAPLYFNDMTQLKLMTRLACQVTHADPRCIASCIALNTAIALIMRGALKETPGEVSDKEKDFWQAIEKATLNAFEKEAASFPELITAVDIEKYKLEITQYLNASLEFLDLDEGWKDPSHPQNRIGYTFKCMGAAFYALRHAIDLQKEGKNKAQIFRIVIEELASEGGDADTNCAPAGALVAVYLQSLEPANKPLFPSDWIEGLADKDVLQQILSWPSHSS